MERGFKNKRADKRAPMSSIIESVNDFRRSRRISLFCTRSGTELTLWKERSQLATVLRARDELAAPLIKTRGRKQFGDGPPSAYRIINRIIIHQMMCRLCKTERGCQLTSRAISMLMMLITTDSDIGDK